MQRSIAIFIGGTVVLVALLVAAGAALMAQKTNMRLIGVVENMTSEVFGSGGGAALAEQLAVPLLGTVPLDSRLRETGDAGEPVVLADPGSDAARAIAEIADEIAQRTAGRVAKPLPLVS